MLAELKMQVEADRPDFGYYQSSNLQGVLMEQIDSGYAERLHEQGLKPYSQYLLRRQDGGCEWAVKTLTKEAYQEIILPLMDGDFTEFTLAKKDIHVRILEKELHTRKKQELLQEFYSGEANRNIQLEFVSPTAFKSNSRYVIIPEVRYLFQSLMNKYSASCEDMEMYDEETLEQLSENTNIIQYRLRSVFFPLEGVKIPSFAGDLTIRAGGTDTMARYARLLARFGEYSGVGVKTAMGMGGLRVREGREKNERQRN